jgi:hypothetical protein
MQRRHWLVGIFCASLGISVGCQGNFESTDVNDLNANSNQPAPTSLRAFRFGFLGHRLTATGGATGNQTGGTTATGGAATGGAATGGVTGAQTGGTTGTPGAATGGVTGGQTGGITGTGGTTTATGGTTPPSGGTASGGTTGAAGCGDGVVQDGELCDRSDLQGASCTSLGFAGGSLACSPTCQFNAAACTGEALTPAISASRTTCTAPCGVAFDTITTTGLSGGDYVAANWDWDFSDPGSKHPNAIGFAAAHVFDNPGTYVVSVRARDLAGASGWATKTVTVSAPSYTTYYVSAAGNDSNNGLSTTAPLKTIAHAWSLLGPNVAIRLRRGDTFAGGSNTMSLTGPCLLGAYTDPAAASTAAPVWSSSIAAKQYNGIFSVQGTDVRVTDLHVVGPGVFAGALISSASHALFERVELEQLGWTGSDGSQNGENFYVDTASNATFLFDNIVHGFIGYMFYGPSVSRVNINGNNIYDFYGGQHGIRIAGGNLTTIVGNTILGRDVSSPQSAITVRGDDTNMVVARNSTNRLIEFTPQNADSVEHVQHGLCEGNVVNDTRVTGYYNNSIGVTANHIVVRNNVTIGNPVSIAVSGMPQMPANWVDKISIYNNTMYFNPASYPADWAASFASRNQTTGSMSVQNNIFALTIPARGSDVKFVISDGKGTFTEDHNLAFDPKWVGSWSPGTGAGDIVGNAQFVATSGTGAFKLQSTSAARNAGAATGAYEDDAAVTRAKETASDIGAYEYKP